MEEFCRFQATFKPSEIQKFTQVNRVFNLDFMAESTSEEGAFAKHFLILEQLCLNRVR